MAKYQEYANNNKDSGFKFQGCQTSPPPRLPPTTFLIFTVEMVNVN